MVLLTWSPLGSMFRETYLSRMAMSNFVEFSHDVQKFL